MSKRRLIEKEFAKKYPIIPSPDPASEKEFLKLFNRLVAMHAADGPKVAEDEMNWAAAWKILKNMRDILRNARLGKAYTRECKKLIARQEHILAFAQTQAADQHPHLIEQHLNHLQTVFDRVKNKQATPKEAWDVISEVNAFFRMTSYNSNVDRDNGLARFHKIVRELKSLGQSENPRKI